MTDEIPTTPAEENKDQKTQEQLAKEKAQQDFLTELEKHHPGAHNMIHQALERNVSWEQIIPQLVNMGWPQFQGWLHNKMNPTNPAKGGVT